ncbi:MAG: hypothetical protein NZM43_02205 [Saprospiraceae bacterium]|nr:hypothetical protein [Saprospiraceae bacterium]MDW8483113.1 hypothetical protein [Saprospiraceae bacterium]
MRTYLSLSFIILLEVILRTVPTTTDQICDGLSERYYYQPSAVGDSVYAFNWAVSGSSYVPTKLVVGNVQFVVEYNPTEEKFVIAGPCSDTSWSTFEVVQEKTLRYQKDGFVFEAQCFRENGGPLKIKIVPHSNTSIEAFR